jgi:hypothetical protein
MEPKKRIKKLEGFKEGGDINQYRNSSYGFLLEIPSINGILYLPCHLDNLPILSVDFWGGRRWRDMTISTNESFLRDDFKIEDINRVNITLNGFDRDGSVYTRWILVDCRLIGYTLYNNGGLTITISFNHANFIS